MNNPILTASQSGDLRPPPGGLWGRPAVDARKRSRDRGVRAWTLVELIGVLAIIAMLVVVGATVGLAYCDQLVRDRERLTLQEMADALRRSVVRDLRIPDQTGYAAQIAAFSGQPVDQIQANGQGNPRLLLIDPGLTNTGFSLPFDQAAAGLSGAGTHSPGNVRMLLVSSLGAPLPVSLGTPPGGMPAGNLFSNCWATSAGQIPSGLDWHGDPADLFLQRIHFQDLFHPVVMNHAEIAGTHTNGQVRLPGMNSFAAPPGAPFPAARWYLHGTTIVLSNAVDATAFSEIVQEGLTFTYEKGRWLRGTESLVTGSSLRSPITGADFEEALGEFLASADSSTGAGTDEGEGTETPAGQGSLEAAQAVADAMANYITLGAMGPSQSDNMAAALDDLSHALLDYTGLPSELLAKP
ncbi:MAG: hypothetical protein KDM81_06840 [Verrucomicrobiae bacterium]|nr:hypothetical protein [Verrucomicrobiae bacterium]